MKEFMQNHSNTPPFSDEDLSPFRQSLNDFLGSKGFDPNWTIRDDQPLQLGILSALSQLTTDADTSLFKMLTDGAPTGILGDIPPSTCFPAALDKSDPDVPLSFSSHY